MILPKLSLSTLKHTILCYVSCYTLLCLAQQNIIQNYVCKVNNSKLCKNDPSLHFHVTEITMYCIVIKSYYTMYQCKYKCQTRLCFKTKNVITYSTDQTLGHTF